MHRICEAILMSQAGQDRWCQQIQHKSNTTPARSWIITQGSETHVQHLAVDRSIVQQRDLEIEI